MAKYKMKTMPDDVKKIKGEGSSDEESLKEIPKESKPKQPETKKSIPESKQKQPEEVKEKATDIENKEPELEKPTPETEQSESKKPGESLPSEPVANLPTVPSEDIAPGKPPEPPKKQSRPEQELPKPKSKLKFTPLIVIVVILLLIAAGTYYWWNHLQAPESPEPTETTISELIAESEKLERIESLGITIPDNLSNKLAKERTFFTFTQQQQARAGMVVKITDPQNIAAALQSWEHEIVKDLAPLFLGHKLDEPATENFQDNTYNNISIRYMNFSDPDLTIDYAIVKNYLLITTSRESIYHLINALLEI